MSTADDKMERSPIRVQTEPEDATPKQTQRKAKGGGAKKKAKEKTPASAGVRVLLWILRKSIVPLIMVIMLAAGLYIGYVVIGKSPEQDVFEWSTWKHLYDLVFAE